MLRKYSYDCFYSYNLYMVTSPLIKILFKKLLKTWIYYYSLDHLFDTQHNILLSITTRVKFQKMKYIPDYFHLSNYVTLSYIIINYTYYFRFYESVYTIVFIRLSLGSSYEKKKKLNLLYFIFCNELYIDYFRKFEEETLGSRIRTEERPLVGKTWTPQLLLFLWSLLVRVNFIFIFFFFSPSYLSLSFAPSFFYHYFDQPQAFLKLLWRRSDNTVHSLFYLAMALSSFRPVLKKFF